MRVTGWRINGFGILNAFEVRDLSSGLIVFEGPNEAGKSTLLAFLRGALFGYPRVSRGKRPHYPPLAGGRHGGQIFLQTASGAVVIDREVNRQPRIILEDGTLLSDAEFQQLIGGIDAQTFRTVFAFSLDELSDFDSLAGEQVRSRIFAAGVGGAGPSTRQVVQDFEKITGQLLKPRSRDAEINSLVDTLAMKERALEEARLRSEQYPELLDEEESLRARLCEVDEQERQARVDVSMYEQLLDLWPVWVDLENDRLTLGSLEPVDSFIPDPLSRLAETKQALASARQSLARMEELVRRKSAAIDEVRSSLVDELWMIAPAVEKQLGLLPFYRDRLHEQEATRARVCLGEERLRAAIEELGVGSDHEALKSVDTSLPRVEQIRRWRSALAEAVERAKQAGDRLETAANVSARAQVEFDRQGMIIDAVVAPDDAGIAARVEALQTLRAGLAELMSKRASLEGREAAARSTTAMMKTGASRSAARRYLEWLAALVVIGVLAVCGAIAAAIVTGQIPLLIVLAVFGLLAFAGAGLLLHRQRSMASVTVPWDSVAISQTEQAEQARIRNEIVQSEAQLLEVSAVLGLDDLPDPRNLEQMEAYLSEEKQASIRWHDQSAELTRAAERLRELKLEEQSARQKLEHAQKEAGSLGQEFAIQLREWGLPHTLSAQGVEEYLRAVAASKEIIFRLEDERAGLVRLQAEVSAWESETARLLERGGSQNALEGDRDVETALLSLSDMCRREVHKRAELTALQDSLSELDVDLARVRHGAGEASFEWESLLGQAAVLDEEAFMAKLRVYEKRQELHRRITEAESTLTKRLGSGPGAASLRKILAEGEVDLWEEKLRELSRQLDQTKAKRSDLIKLQGDTERRRRDLEESTDVPGLETGVEGLRTELQSALHRWRVHTLAVALIRETLNEFTRERQPTVLAEASRMFGLVTEGRYKRVFRTPDEEGIVVADRNGLTKAPEDLSRGAAEQLYLCLRLGLAEEFSRRAEPIPLVMDDVLVNFDPARRVTTARLLLEFAERHQVLLFTCHPEITDLVKRERPDVFVVHMS